MEENNKSVVTANENTAMVLHAVEQSNRQISQAVKIIEDIRVSTSNISQLANTIEDISFQTNILALKLPLKRRAQVRPATDSPLLPKRFGV